MQNNIESLFCLTPTTNRWSTNLWCYFWVIYLSCHQLFETMPLDGGEPILFRNYRLFSPSTDDVVQLMFRLYLMEDPQKIFPRQSLFYLFRLFGCLTKTTVVFHLFHDTPRASLLFSFQQLETCLVLQKLKQFISNKKQLHYL